MFLARTVALVALERTGGLLMRSARLPTMAGVHWTPHIRVVPRNSQPASSFAPADSHKASFFIAITTRASTPLHNTAAMVSSLIPPKVCLNVRNASHDTLLTRPLDCFAEGMSSRSSGHCHHNHGLEDLPARIIPRRGRVRNISLTVVLHHRLSEPLLMQYACNEWWTSTKNSLVDQLQIQNP